MYKHVPVFREYFHYPAIFVLKMIENENTLTWLILGLRTANERRRYKVTPSLIGWAQA